MLSAVGSVVSSAVCVTVSMGAPQAPADAEFWVLQYSQPSVESVDLERAAVFAKALATHNAPLLVSNHVRGAYELLVFGILGGSFDVLGCLKYTMIKGCVCCRHN